jgi:hypothetical protein
MVVPAGAANPLQPAWKAHFGAFQQVGSSPSDGRPHLISAPGRRFIAGYAHINPASAPPGANCRPHEFRAVEENILVSKRRGCESRYESISDGESSCHRKAGRSA